MVPAARTVEASAGHFQNILGYALHFWSLEPLVLFFFLAGVYDRRETSHVGFISVPLGVAAAEHRGFSSDDATRSVRLSLLDFRRRRTRHFT